MSSNDGKTNPRGNSRQFSAPMKSPSQGGPNAARPVTSNAFASPRSPDLLKPQNSRIKSTLNPSPTYKAPELNIDIDVPPDIEQAQFRKNVRAYSERATNRAKYDPLKSSQNEDVKDTNGYRDPDNISINVNSPPASSLNSGEKKKPSDNNQDDSAFKGENPLQYAILGHYMTIGSTLLCFFVGIFAILWDNPYNYKCKIDGKYIHKNYLSSSNITSSSFELCSEKYENDLEGSSGIGSIFIIYSIFLFFVDNRYFGYGLYYRSDSYTYIRQFSPLSLSHIVIGIIGLGAYSTVLAAVCLLVNGVVLGIAAYRFEAGDGGRAQRAAAALALEKSKEQTPVKKEVNNENCLEFLMALPMRTHDRFIKYFEDLAKYNPGLLYIRLVKEDKLSIIFWTSFYVFINLMTFGVVLNEWFIIIDDFKKGLLDGTLDLSCSDKKCDINRQMIISGPPSSFAPWAKASAYGLYLNSLLILVPVTKTLLTSINNAGVSYHDAQKSSSIFAKFFAGPFLRYFPLDKHLDMHKLCASAIFYYSWIHMLCHYGNLVVSNDTSLVVFKMYGWSYFAYFSGAIIVVAMFFIYSGASQELKKVKFEAFFNTHHFFMVYFFFLFIHAQSFWAWGIWPVMLYIYDKYLQSFRGINQFVVIKVDWVSPVLQLYIRPLIKDSFTFKEGEYIHLNCPTISTSQWHPFTISSASEDLNNGARIHLLTGEEVVEVPRPPPSVWPPDAKWNKFAKISQDWRAMQINTPHLLLDKSDTGYFDMISMHIKVHGKGTWTYQLKEYFENYCSEKNADGEAVYPIYFSRVDSRGDVNIGRLVGANNLPLVLLDGPHSAPAEHYYNYQTCMLVGAGIGLTPCSSILTSLLKYKWKKNHPTEILHFFWVVKYDELESFQWFVHLLTELSFELKKNKDNHQIERHYFLEINIYVTSVPKAGEDAIPLPPLKRPVKKYSDANGIPTFTAEQLYALLKNPKVDSRTQKEQMSSVSTAKNRLQNIWVWNGRPNWDIIFQDIKAQRQHQNIGVCFCGTPAIGADLKEMCNKYSNPLEDCIFSLNKENF